MKTTLLQSGLLLDKLYLNIKLHTVNDKTKSTAVIILTVAIFPKYRVSSSPNCRAVHVK